MHSRKLKLLFKLINTARGFFEVLVDVKNLFSCCVNLLVLFRLELDMNKIYSHGLQEKRRASFEYGRYGNPTTVVAEEKIR